MADGLGSLLGDPVFLDATSVATDPKTAAALYRRSKKKDGDPWTPAAPTFESETQPQPPGGENQRSYQLSQSQPQQPQYQPPGQQGSFQPSQVQLGEAPPELQKIQSLEAQRLQGLPDPSTMPTRDHPGLGRRILASTLGGLAGIRDPRAGVEVGERIMQGDYQDRLADWERKNKLAMEVAKETGTGLGQMSEAQKQIQSARLFPVTVADTRSQIEGRTAEAERARAAAAKDLWENSDAGRKYMEDSKIRIAQAGIAPNIEAYVAKDASGKPVTYFVNKHQTGAAAITGPDGKPVDISGFTDHYKISGEPKPATPKNQVPEVYIDEKGQHHDGYFDTGTGKRHLADGTEKPADWRTYKEPTEKIVVTGGSETPAQLRLAARPTLNDAMKVISDSRERLKTIDTAMNSIESNTQLGDTLSLIEGLKALVVSRGGAVRITNAEIQQMFGGQTKPEQARTWINTWINGQGEPKFPPQFRAALMSLLKGEKKRIITDYTRANTARSKLQHPTSSDDIAAAADEFYKLDEEDQNQSQDPGEQMLPGGIKLSDVQKKK